MRTAAWTDTVSVLDRVTAVLDAFGDEDGLGVSEIARRANLPKSTVSRIVADLVRQRYLDREGDTLHLGLKLFELGQSVELPMRLRRVARPLMSELHAITGACVRLGVLDGQNVVIVASITGVNDPAGQFVPGSRIAAHSSAMGRAILAHSPDDDRLAALSARPDGLEAALVEARRTGLASCPAIGAPGSACVATAVCIGAGTPLGALALAGPAEMVDARRVGDLLRSAAAALVRRWALSP